jgi:tetratricopeptide (TPR) repeat protein
MASVIDSSSLSALFSVMSDTTARDNAAINALNSGLTLFQNKKYQQAAAAFRQALAYNPGTTGNMSASTYDNIKSAYSYMAQSYLKLHNDKEAISAYKQSLQFDPTQDDVYVSLANVYIQDKRPADAEKVLRTATRLNPSNVVAPYTLGQLLVQQNRPQEAEPFFKKAVKLSPKDGNAYYGLGLSLEQQGKTDEAIQALQKATSLKKDFTAAIYELGNAYAKNGQNDKAQTQIDILTKMDTSDSLSNASTLTTTIKQPKILAIDTVKSTFNTTLGPASLLALDSHFIQPDASKEVSVSFIFDSTMDPSTINNITNWSIRKAQGSVINRNTGLYDNGAYRASDKVVPPMPSRVVYDPTTQKATIYFSLRQNGSASGTIDTSRIIFSFSGKDVNGKKMDTTADQIDGFAGKAF